MAGSETKPRRRGGKGLEDFSFFARFPCLKALAQHMPMTLTINVTGSVVKASELEWRDRNR